MSVRCTRLPSGLRIITDVSPNFRTAAIGLFAGVGSRNEFEEEHGLAHLLEHMAFKGTRRRNAREIAATVENVGGDLNAETGAEQTGYFAYALGEHVPDVFDLLADIYVDSQFDDKELEREKQVILEEISALEDAPEEWVFDLAGEAAWPGQTLGRPILGTRASVPGFSGESLRRYLARGYTANSTLVVAAGLVNHDQLVELAAEKLHTLQTVDGPASTPALYSGGQRLVRKPSTQTHTVVAFEGRGAADRDLAAAEIFAAASGAGMASRLFQEVREKRGLAYSIHSFHWAFAETGMFGFYAGSSPSKTGELIDVALDCMSKASVDLTDEEVARAKAQTKVSTFAALESPTARIQQIARQTFAFGAPLSLEEMTERLDRLSLEEIRAVGKSMLKSNPVVAAIGRLGVGRKRGGAALESAIAGIQWRYSS